jgi:uncharacterized FAD-dependent dehydrogenase
VPRYRLSGIRTRAPQLPDAPLAERLLGAAAGSLSAFLLVRRSLDARKKPDLFYESAVEFDAAAPLRPDVAPPLKFEEVPPPRGPELLLPPLGRKARVVVVGTGPAGLFAALALADAGVAITLLERGDAAEDRYRKVMRFWTTGDFDPESNVQFGEGGAGTFSDGKLTCGKRHDRIAVVLETLHRFGAPDTILFDAKPHIGTDRLVVLLRNVRRHLRERGAEIRFRAKVVDVVRGGSGPLSALVLASGEEIPCTTAIFALGHSARDTVAALRLRGAAMTAKAFAMGVRIEHPQDRIDRIQYGRLSASCGVFPADYRQTHLSANGRGVYTFCMCPGGEVIACSSEAGGVVTNGMSRYKRVSGFANSGLVVQTKEGDFAGESGPEVLRGQAYQRRVERAAFALGGGTYAAPAIRVTDFLNGRRSRAEPRDLPKTTYGPAVVPRRLDALYPAPYLDALAEGILAFDRKMKGFVSDEALLIAPESRTSSPVRIERDDACESTIPGLFPAGEGAGFAGGIVSAALDGLRVARAVHARLSGISLAPGRGVTYTGPEY